jgi:hypothetical protein
MRVLWKRRSGLRFPGMTSQVSGCTNRHKIAEKLFPGGLANGGRHNLKNAKTMIANLPFIGQWGKGNSRAV